MTKLLRDCNPLPPMNRPGAFNVHCFLDVEHPESAAAAAYRNALQTLLAEDRARKAAKAEASG